MIKVPVLSLFLVKLMNKNPKVTPTKKPNPGSPEAIAAGCLCPVLDNSHGNGYLGQPGLFYMASDCPIHHLSGDNLDIIV